MNLLQQEILLTTLGGDHYQLKIDKSAMYEPLGAASSNLTKTAQYTISVQTLLHMDELVRRAAICSSITDLLVASLLEKYWQRSVMWSDLTR